jgi:hypothetical protein
MKKYFLLIFAVLLPLFSFYCKGTTDLSETDFVIAGKWNWIKSEGWPKTITPEQVGFTKQIVFDLAGTYYEYKNNTVLFKSNYRVVEQDINSDNIPEQIISIDDKPFQYTVEYSRNDTLLLRIINCDDCTNKEYYKRIK